MGSSSTIKLVKAELENAIEEVQKNFSAFADDTSQITLLEDCIDQVNRIRGTFVMLEDKGASLLCEELTKLLNEIPLEDLTARTARGKKVSDAVFQSMLFLGRYLEYIELKGSGCAELLIPEINLARRARGISQLPDHHFYPLKLVKPVKPRAAVPFRYSGETAGLIRRYRHMYQAALVKMLQGYRPQVALTYMGRSLSQLDKLAGNTAIAPLFWIASAVTEVMVEQKADLTPNRKLMFSRLDKQIKQLQQKGENGFHSEPPSDLIAELLYIVAICRESSAQAERIANVYKLADAGITESELIEQRRLLSSPGSSVMQSVSKALNEEMNAVKDMLDTAAVGGTGDFHPADLQSTLSRLADILSMVGLNSPANVLRKQMTVVASWPAGADPDMIQLMAIADAVLYAESAVQRLLYDGGLSDKDDYVSAAAEAQVNASRMMLIDQSQNSISHAKRAISAFVESGTDQQHVAAVSEQLDLVRGAFVFLESPDGESIVRQCMTYVEKHLVADGAGKPDPKALEALADALSGLEFYLEGLLNESTPNRQLLAVAKEAAAQLV